MKKLLHNHDHLAEGYLGLCEAIFQQGNYHWMKPVATGYRKAVSGQKPDRATMAATELWIR